MLPSAKINLHVKTDESNEKLSLTGLDLKDKSKRPKTINKLIERVKKKL
ncbi:MAG: hypothetical protein Q8P57_03285 [Candidatus Pacearchaeota archaeon]|nr:hypothetical protein [Candidatus Pacearchaeota archaeon]